MLLNRIEKLLDLEICLNCKHYNCKKILCCIFDDHQKSWDDSSCDDFERKLSWLDKIFIFLHKLYIECCDWKYYTKRYIIQIICGKITNHEERIELKNISICKNCDKVITK